VDPEARILGPCSSAPGLGGGRGHPRRAAQPRPGTRVGRGAVVSRSVLWSSCRVGEESFVDRCMMADGVAVEPRTSVFALVKVADGHAASPSSRLRVASSALWSPSWLP